MEFPTRMLRHLSNDEFDAAIQGSNICQKNLDMLKRVLVDKEMQITVAEELGMTKQRVSYLTRKIVRRHQRRIGRTYDL